MNKQYVQPVFKKHETLLAVAAGAGVTGVPV